MRIHLGRERRLVSEYVSEARQSHRAREWGLIEIMDLDLLTFCQGKWMGTGRMGTGRMGTGRMGGTMKGSQSWWALELVGSATLGRCRVRQC